MSLRTLTRTEMRWAEGTFSAIFPREEESGMPIGICDLDLRGFLRDTFARIPLDAAFGLRVAIWIVAFAPLIVLRRMATIHGLAPKEREQVVTALMASPIYAVRQLVFALKAIGAMLYAAAPEVRARMMPPTLTTPLLLPLTSKAAKAEPYVPRNVA